MSSTRIKKIIFLNIVITLLFGSARADSESTHQPGHNIYKSCSLPTHKPIYNRARKPICGVERILNYPRETCGPKFLSCRSVKNPLEKVVPSSRPNISWLNDVYNGGWHRSSASSLQGSDADLSECNRHLEIVTEIATEKVRVNPPFLLKWEDTTVERSIQPIPIENTCFGVRGCLRENVPAYRCNYTFRIDEMIYEDKPNRDCGFQSFESCDEITYKECVDPTFGIESHESAPDSKCGIEKSLLLKLDDREYFNLVISNLNSFVVTHDTRFIWDELGILLGEDLLKGREISFSFVAELKVVLNSINFGRPTLATQNEFAKIYKLLVIDFYTRVTAQYNNKKLKASWSLRSLRTDLKKQNILNADAAAIAIKSVKGLGLSATMEKVVVASIQQASIAETNKLLAVINDLEKLVQQDVDLRNMEIAEFVKSLAEIDPIFQANLVEVYISSGNYSQAQIKLTDAHYFFRSLPKLNLPVDGNWIHSQLQANAKIRAKSELDAVSQVFNLMSHAESMPSFVIDENGKEIKLSGLIMQLLNDFQVSIGDPLSGTKMQILSLIELNLLDPLKSLLNAMGS